jgi:hypothetical protein
MRGDISRERDCRADGRRAAARAQEDCQHALPVGQHPPGEPPERRRSAQDEALVRVERARCDEEDDCVAAIRSGCHSNRAVLLARLDERDFVIRG